MSKYEQQQNLLPAIQMGRIKVLKVHQISDDELTRLGQGSRQSLFLNLGIAVLSVAVSFLISLLTTTIASDRVFVVFVFATVVGFVAGIALIIQWWCMRQPISRLVQEIRDRMPPQGEAEQLDPPNSEGCADALSGAGEP